MKIGTTNSSRLGWLCSGAYDDEDSDDEDEVFCDPDTDPDILRKVYVLEGQMDDEDEDEEDGGAGDDDDAAGSNFALRPDGYADDEEGDEEVSLESQSCSCELIAGIELSVCTCTLVLAKNVPIFSMHRWRWKVL